MNGTPTTSAIREARGRFDEFVQDTARRGVVVQPRLGFSDPQTMRRALNAVKHSAADAAGTITLDSFTRTGQHERASRAIQDGEALNGYPLVAHPAATTAAMVEDLHADDFPIQVRHGTALPGAIFARLAETRLDATEGGPISYTLPYSRVRLQEAVAEWRRSCQILSSSGTAGHVVHLETFGGCMLGQLCPPSLLVALSVLEGLFFQQHGIRSLSLSYAQQTSFTQDVAAVVALRELAGELFTEVNWHVLIYTYMGVYPKTTVGAFRILEGSARLAAATESERLIVKTPAEAHRIPTIAENVSALEFASQVARSAPGSDVVGVDEGELDAIKREATRFIDAVLNLDDDVGAALIKAFSAGLLDVPFCLHADNANITRAAVDPFGRLAWTDTGALPIESPRTAQPVRSGELLRNLNFNQSRFDRLALHSKTAKELA